VPTSRHKGFPPSTLNPQPSRKPIHLPTLRTPRHRLAAFVAQGLQAHARRRRVVAVVAVGGVEFAVGLAEQGLRVDRLRPVDLHPQFLESGVAVVLGGGRQQAARESQMTASSDSQPASARWSKIT
jgi:hypothetical protein